jgi:hypothetical protein
MSSQQVVKPHFFENAIAAYGYDGAYALGQTMMASLQAAQDRLPLLSPVQGIRPLIHASTESFTIQGYAMSKAGIIELAFAPDVDIGVILSEIPAVIEHETAHIAHAQRNPALWERDAITDIFLVAAALKEGIARHAEYQLSDNYEPGIVLNYRQTKVDKIMGALADALFRAGADQEARHYDFLYGDEAFPDKGYVIGHYVVASMAAVRGSSIRELMELPVEEYMHFMGFEV